MGHAHAEQQSNALTAFLEEKNDNVIESQTTALTPLSSVADQGHGPGDAYRCVTQVATTDGLVFLSAVNLVVKTSAVQNHTAKMLVLFRLKDSILKQSLCDEQKRPSFPEPYTVAFKKLSGAIRALAYLDTKSRIDSTMTSLKATVDAGKDSDDVSKKIAAQIAEL